MEPLFKFHDLVRAAAHAQELFDRWDDGATWDGFGRLTCTLDQVSNDWREAHLKLVEHVLANGGHLLKCMEEETK